MADADVRIPTDLLPKDGRFNSGPSKVRVETVDALAATGTSYLGTSHRRTGVRSTVARVREGLRDLFGLPDGYEVLLGNGGSSLFWDAATFGLIDDRSQHLVFGEFSAKFAQAAASAPHLAAPEIIETEPGTHPGARHNPEVDVYALTHNETSTGVVMPIERPAGAGRDQLVVVDGTSAAGGVRVDPTQFDAYYFAPQKCFAGDGGLWLALCSPAAIERISTIGVSDRWVPAMLSLPIALENSRLDQTYNTPALATIFMLADQIDWMLGLGGLDAVAQRCDESATILYGWADSHELARPFVAAPAERSPVTGTIDFDSSVDAAWLAASLRANGIVDTEPYRKLGRNQLRIAMFPAIDPGDVLAVTRCIDFLLDAR